MKTLKMLLKASYGKPVFKLTGFWMIYLGMHILFNTNSIPTDFLMLLQVFLIIWTIGYLFLVASRMAKGAEEPLIPMQYVSTFVLGFKVSLRLICIFAPLILSGTILYSIQPEAQYFEKICLVYIVLIVAPYLLLITANSDKLPWIKGLWTLFKKNAPTAFAFIFWLPFSFTVYTFVAKYILQFSTSSGMTLFFSFLLFIAFFWLLLFNAVLLGFLAKKTVISETKNNVIENKSEKK